MTTLHDHSLELRVLATLADVSGLDVAEAKTAAERSSLVAEDFHNPLHRNIWTAQMGLLFDGEACDFYRVRTRLQPDEREKVAPLIEAAGQVGVSLLIASAIRGAANDLRAMTLRRNILRFGRELAQMAEGTTDPTVLLTNATAALSRITTSRAASWRTLAEVLEVARREMLEIAEGRGSPVIPTGLREWDRIIGGLWPTLTVLGSHPGSGKSGVIARLLLNLAAAGKKVAVFSLEDQATWLAYRALASASRVTQFVLRNRKLTGAQEEAVHNGTQELVDLSRLILIDDRGRLPSQEVVQSARDAILNHGAQVVVIDHYGEITHDTDRSDRHDLMIASGLSDLRNLSKGYGVPIVIAAHLKPLASSPFSTSDFANSAAFERMARVLVAWEKKDDVLKVQVLKHTNGVRANFDLHFDGPSAMAQNPPEDIPKAVQKVIPF